MLCKHQTVLEESCIDGTSRAIYCKAGYDIACMKYCNESCKDYASVMIPKPVSTRSAYHPASAEEHAYRERIMQMQEKRMHGCCGR